MQTKQIQPFTRGVDTVAKFTLGSAVALEAQGYNFVVRYLGSLDANELSNLLSAGLLVMPVTFADTFNGEVALQQLAALSIPKGTTVWLDVEGITSLDAPTLEASINTWASAVKAGGYDPGIYVGANSLLTSAELYALVPDRYWHSCSRIVDRFGAVAEPLCGWTMRQLRPDDVVIAGTKVDVNVVEQDYQGRLPTAVSA